MAKKLFVKTLIRTTMKKIYIAPSTKAVCLNTESLIANSFTGGTGTGGIDTGSEGGSVEDTRRQQGGNSLWDTWSN